MTPSAMNNAMLNLLLIAAALVGMALAAGIVWASLDSNVVEGLGFLMANRWGVVTLIDVYAGAVAVATWIWLCERRVTTWLPWVIALLCLGHVISLAYILYRAGKRRDPFCLDDAARRASGGAGSS